MTDGIAVVNSSPLIILCRSGLLGVLHAAGETVLIPDPVMKELRRRGDSDITVRLVLATPWLRVVQASPVSAIVAAWDLGEGESSVITCAEATPGATAVLDDLQARRCAEALRIRVRGTLGLIVLAKQQGMIPNAIDAVHAVRRTGLYVSEALVAKVLRLAGE